MKLTTLPDFVGAGGRLAFRAATGAGPDLRRPSDPVNLLFLGDTDPLRIRTAFLSLPAERDSSWEIVSGRGARWRDAIGHVQTAYVKDHGWSASAVQLELGRYKRSRAHLRLFPFRGFTLAAAHVEFLPEGSFEHQVVSWALGEELVVSELRRAGLLEDPPARIGPFETGLSRQIEASVIGRAPEDLTSLAGFAAPTGGPIAIPGDGYLTVLRLAPLPVAESERSWTRVRLDLATDVRSPYPDSTDGRLRICGPLRLEQELVAGSGSLTVRLAVRGSVTVDDDRIGEVSESQIIRLRRQRTRTALVGDYRVLARPGYGPSWRRHVRTRLTSGADPSHRGGPEP